MIQIKKFVFNPFQENTYLLYDETKECVIIDPGCYEKNEKEELYNFIKDNDLKPVKLLNTHCHIDHVLGNYYVSKTFQLDLEMHEFDLITLNNIPNYAHLYGFNGYELSPQPSTFLNEGDQVKFGHSILDILFCPGHAPGHIVFYSLEDNFVINGDVLFQGSYGRVDLPGGDFQTLKNSITQKMFSLPDDMVVYTGHGNSTMIGIEKRSNPILY